MCWPRWKNGFGRPSGTSGRFEIAIAEFKSQIRRCRRARCMEWGRLVGGSFLCGGVMFAVGTAFHFLTPLVAPQLAPEYRNEVLFRPWDGWTRSYMIVHPWLYCMLFAAVFLGARMIVGSVNLGGVRDGLLYGLAVFVVGS